MIVKVEKPLIQQLKRIAAFGQIYLICDQQGRKCLPIRSWSYNDRWLRSSIYQILQLKRGKIKLTELSEIINST